MEENIRARVVFVIVLKSAALYLSVPDGQVRPKALLTPFQMQGKLYRYEDLLFPLFSKYHSAARIVFSRNEKDFASSLE